MIKEYNNLLNTNYFDELNSLVTDPNFAWHLNKNTSHNDGNFMFTHVLYNDEAGVNSNYYESFLPLIIKAGIAIGQSTLLRAKLNLYTNQGKSITHATHIDYDETIGEYTSAVFNFTTCDGGTYIEEKFFVSEANSMCSFPGPTMHSGVTQTDTPVRVLLNLNYIDEFKVPPLEMDWNDV